MKCEDSVDRTDHPSQHAISVNKLNTEEEWMEKRAAPAIPPPPPTYAPYVEKRRKIVNSHSDDRLKIKLRAKPHTSYIFSVYSVLSIMNCAELYLIIYSKTIHKDFFWFAID